MIKKHITNRIISLFMVILLLPWSVFIYSEKTEASSQLVSQVSFDDTAELTYDDMTIALPYELTDDLEVNNLFLNAGSHLDLSGHTITIHGNIYHSGRYITVTNGTVVFNGDSKIQEYYPRNYMGGEVPLAAADVQKESQITMDAEVIVRGNLDIYYHTLIIQYDLIQPSGNIYINQGHLSVHGNYRMQEAELLQTDGQDETADSELKEGTEVIDASEPNDEEKDPENNSKFSFGPSAATFLMDQDVDRLDIDGNFYVWTTIDDAVKMKAGVFTLKGSILTTKETSLWAFFCYWVKLVLAGDEEQLIDCKSLAVNTLELRNKGKITSKNRITVSRELIADYSDRFEGEISIGATTFLNGDGFSGSIYTNGWVSSREGYHIGGNFTCSTSDLTIEKETIIDGDFIIYSPRTQIRSNVYVGGNLYEHQPGNGTALISLSAAMYVDGNVQLDQRTSLQFVEEDSLISVQGDFINESTTGYNKGIIQVGGDLNLDSFDASGSNRVILNGDGFQTITVSKDVKFATLETLNPSEDGVLATAPFEVDRLIRNGYRFRYIDEEGNEREFTDADDFVPVKDLSAEEGVSFITLSFSDPNENPEAAGYDILRSTDGESFFKVASVKKFNASVENETGEGSPDKTEPVLQSYTDQNLQPDTTYYYKVIAFDHFWNRADESDVLEVHTLPDTTAPTVPAGLRVTMRAGRSIGLAWNVSKDDVGLAGYRIYRDGMLLVDEPVTTLRYTDGSLTDDEIHKYSVSAVDASGNESEKSIEIATAAASPLITRVSPETSRFGGESAHFSVFCRNYSNAGSTVRAEYTYDDVLTGNEQSANWVAVSEEETGTIHYSSYEQVADLYWNITGLPSGLVRVRFILRDSSGAETSPYGNIYEYEIDHTSPDAPRIVSADGDGGNIHVTWESSPSSDCAGYVIYRRVLGDDQESEQDDPTQSSDENHTQDYGMETDTASDLIKLAEVSSATHEYVDRTLAQGTTALYYVTAVDDLGNESDPAEPALVNAGPDTISPEVKALSPDGGKIGGNTEIKAIVQDNCVVKEVQFYIRRTNDQVSAQQEEWTLLGTGSEPVISISAGQTTEPVTYETAFSFDTTDFPDGTYQIKAIAFDASGNGSEVADPTVTGSSTEFYRSYEIDNTGISGLGILEPKAGSTFVQLTWNSVDEEDFDYFLVEQMMDSEAVYKEVARENSYTGCTISNLTPETAYTFRVCAVDTVGNKGEYTEPVTVTTLPDETAPVIRSIGPSQGRVRDILPLTMTVTDNYMASYAVWSLSFDGENFTELVRTDQSGTVRESGTDEERTWSFDLDLSDEEAYPEGKIYIRFEAYDAYENHSAPLPDGSEVVAEYEIDRTAPDQPHGIRGVGYDGYISVTWENGAEEDIRTYQVYRTEMIGNLQAALAEGRFTCVMDAANLNYYDTDVEDGKSYAYYVTAKDEAGNISVRSEVIFATALPDETEPVVAGVSPKDGATIGKETRFSVIAKDNSNLSCMRMYYRRADSGLWTLLREEEISGTIDRIDFTYNFSNEEEGTIQFKTVLEDRNGNVSEDFITTCTLDKTPPTAELTAANGHFENILTLTRDPLETDFYYYEIYRCELSYAWNDLQFYSRAAGLKKLTVDAEDPFVNGEGRRSLTWIDKDVIPGENYRYAARVYDRAGNYSWTEIGDAKADSLDAVEPVIVFPDMVTGLEGRDIVLDAGECYDNVKISDYFWDIQGSNIQGENSAPARGVRHTVRLDAGKHTATLTVKDRAGNMSSKTFTIRVKEPSKTATCHLTLTDTNGMPIPFAYVYIQAGGDADQALMTDACGQVDLTYKRGRYKVAAFKDGYLPAEKEIEITQDIIDRCNSEDFQYRETLTLSSGEVVVGDFEVHQMSLQEMEEAGVDFSDPANLNTFTFRTVLTFQSTPLPVVVEDIPLDPEVIFDDELKGDGFQTQNFTINLSGGKEDNKNQPVTKVTVMTVPAEEHIPIVAIMTTTQAVSWLKSMYSANLTITNMADNQYVLEDSTATIELPDGISLAALKNDSVTVTDAILEPTQTESEIGEAQGQDDNLNPQPIVERETGQKLTIDMGDIPGQTSRTASWVLRGDKSGSYDISALYTGILTPFRVPISKRFEANAEIEVEKANVEIAVMPEKAYYLGEDYCIQYEITNKGTEPLYNFTTSIGDYRLISNKEDVLIRDPDSGDIIDRLSAGGKIAYTLPVNRQLYNAPVLQGEDTLMIPTLMPGQTVYGTWLLGEGDYETYGFAGNSDEIYYKLIDTLVDVIEGENLGVHVVVRPIPSHVTKYISTVWVGEQLTVDVGDPVDMSSGAFRDSITALSLTGRDELSIDLQYDSIFAAEAARAEMEKKEASEDENTNDSQAPSYADKIKNTCGYGWYTDYDTWIEEKSGMVFLYLNPYVSIPFVTENAANARKTDISASDTSGNEAAQTNDDTDDSEVESDNVTNIVLSDLAGDEEIRYISLMSGTDGYSLLRHVVRNETTGTNEVHYTLETPSGVKVEYTGSGESDSVMKYDLSCYTSEEGNVTTVSYSSKEGGYDQIITEVISGNMLTLSRNFDGKLLSVSDGNGRKTSLEYDDAGNLVSVKNPLGEIVTYSYDKNHCMVKSLDPDGNLIVRNTYETIDSADSLNQEEESVDSTDETENESGTEPSDETENTISEEERNIEFRGVHYDREFEEGRVKHQELPSGAAIEFEYYRASNGNSLAVSELSHDGTVDVTTAVCDDHGRIVYAEDPSSSVDYSYDENGNLIYQQGSDGSWFSYTYDDRGRIIETEAYNSDPTRITYDEDDNPIEITTTSESGKEDKSTFRYENGKLVSGTAKGITANYSYGDDGFLSEIEVPGGGTTIYKNDGIRLTGIQNARGAEVTYGYDCYGNINFVKDPLDNETRYIYDAMNRLIQVVDPKRKSIYYTYNSLGLLTSEKDQLGRVICYDYDVAGRLGCITYPDGTRVTLSYDMLGRLTKRIFAEGTEEEIAEQYTYDAAGNITGIIYADGSKEEISYDERNHITAIKNAAGVTTGYTYDEKGQMTGMTSANQAEVWFAYLDHNVVSITADAGSIPTTANPINAVNGVLNDNNVQNVTIDPTEISTVSQVEMTYSYDDFGNLISEADPLGNVTKHVYDRFGNVIEDIDPNGNGTAYEYDVLGECTAVIYPNGLRIERIYDYCGNVTKESIVTSDKQRYEYTYAYDEMGLCTESVDESGRVTSYTYDDAGQLTKVEDEFGNYVITTYDCMGRVKKETDNSGNTAEYEYDRMGNLIHSTYTAVSGNASNNAKEYSYTYDQLGRLLTVTDPKKSVTSQTFDVLGQVTRVTDANGGITEYTYDNSGNIISETNAIGVTKTYEYDTFDNLVKSTNGRSNVTTYQYDLCGRLASFTDDVGTVTFEYDDNGNVIKISERKKKLDSEGNDITETSEAKTITRIYDNMNRVTEVTDVNGKTIKYSYDELGNILTIEYPGGEIVRYTYNPDSTLESFVDGAGRTTSYTYDRQGRKERVTRPDGSVETTTYNAQSQVATVIDCAADGKLLQKYEYTYDGWGNITSIKEAVKPDYEINHTPEAFGVGAEVSDGSEESGSAESTGDDAEDGVSSNTTTSTASNTATNTETTESVVISTMEYNAANQLIRFNGKEVKYDADGNMTYGPLSGEMTTFTYDCRNRLISAGGENYKYDAENVLISVETENYVETYITDRVYPLSRTLVIERNSKQNDTVSNGNQNNKSLITTCYYGEGLVYDVTIFESDNQNATNNNNSTSDSINQTSVNSNATGQPELRIYHFDHLGSTRYLTDENSNITLYFDYGTYGEFLGCHNADYSECDFSMLENPVRFLYNGELGVLTNDNSLLYMRQRFYNPEIKRFINQDVLTGTISNSLSLNRYSYVEGNPISFTDPFGLSKLRDTLRGISNTYNIIKNSITHMSVHTMLDLLGVIPGIGSLFDLSNAALYALEGKRKEALESLVFAIPTTDLVGAGEKVAKFFGKDGKKLTTIAKIIKISGTAAAVYIAADRTGQGIASLIDDYAVAGRKIDLQFWLRALGTGVGAVQTTAYGRTLGKDIIQYTNIESNLQEIMYNSEEKPITLDDSILKHGDGIHDGGNGLNTDFIVSPNGVVVDSRISKESIPETKFTSRKIQHEYSHAGDFGIEGNWDNAKGLEYQNAIQNNINNATDIFISKYRGTDVYVYYNSNTGLGSYVDYSGNYIGGWKFSTNQLNYHSTNGYKVY